MRKPFVMISGLPGSGKTTLARRLAPALRLPLIDKDDILERLYESKGVGNAAWRRALSRESDAILQREAEASGGAVLSSFWHVPGMPEDSGTPTDWLRTGRHHVVNVHCTCEVEVAVSRVVHRRRHPGHLDAETTPEDLLASLLELSYLPPLHIGHRIDVDTTQEPDLHDVVRTIAAHLGHGLP